MDTMLKRYVDIIGADPAVDTVNGTTRRRTWRSNEQRAPQHFPEAARGTKGQRRPDYRQAATQTGAPSGATLYLTAFQDLRVGGRQSNAQYQYSLRSDSVQDLTAFGPRMLAELKTIPIITDVNSDQQNHGLQTYVEYDRKTAARLGISPQLVDNTLYDAFGQRPVSTMYTSLNQYHVVMERRRNTGRIRIFSNGST